MMGLKSLSRIFAFLAIVFFTLIPVSLFSEELPWSSVEQSTKTEDVLSPQKLPEWDGIYIVTKNGYIELTPGNTFDFQECYKRYDSPIGVRGYFPYWFTCFGRILELEGKRPLIVPQSDFLGILIKGEDYLKGISLKKTKREERSLLFGKGKSYDFTMYPDKSIPFDKFRRRTIAPGVYFFSPRDPVEVFGSVEKGEYVTLWHSKKAMWVFGIQSGGTFGTGN